MSSRTIPRRVVVGGTVALSGTVAFAACALVARNGKVGGAEETVFHAVNGAPEWLYQPMWLFQQAGNIVVAFLVVLAAAAVMRKPKLAAAAVVAVGAKLALERVVKDFVHRTRPGTSVGDVILRGQVSDSGLSFVSGHAVITVAMAMVLTAVLHGRWKLLPWVFAVLNGVARIYVGAHNPLDVIGGAGVGLVIGGLLYAWLAEPDPSPTTAVPVQSLVKEEVR